MGNVIAGSEFKKFRVGDVVPEYEVYELVRKLHYCEEDFDSGEGNIGEVIEEYESYKVVEVSLDTLHKVSVSIDDYLVFEYTDLDPREMPPIVLGYFDGSDDYLILDGNHRVTMLRELGIEKTVAFAGIKHN